MGPAKTRFRRLRFSLRSLIVGVTALCVLFGAHSFRVNSANTQRKTVENLRQRGVYVEYDFDIIERPYPGWLFDFLGRDYLYGVDAVLIAERDNVDSLIATASTLQSLKRIRIEICTLQHDSLRPLTGASEVEHLSLFHCNAGDHHLELLQGMPKLRVLDLRGTEITDKSVDVIIGLKNLKFLLLKDTEMSDAEIKRISEALPNCDVNTKR